MIFLQVKMSEAQRGEEEKRRSDFNFNLIPPQLYHGAVDDTQTPPQTASNLFL
jgi:hypothetical protein